MKLFPSRQKKTPQPPEPSRRRAVQLSDRNRQGTFTYYANRSVTPAGTSGRDIPSTRIRPDAVPVRQPFWRRAKVLPWLGIAAGVIVVGWLTTLSTSATVLTIDSSGALTTVTNTQYEETVATLLGQSIMNRNKLTVNATGIARELEKRHPEIENATFVVPIFGNRPRVYVSLSEPAFVLQSQGVRYVLSASGYITGKASGSLKLPLIVDETDETVTVSQRLLPASHVAFMQTVDYQLTHKGLSVDNFILPKTNAYEVDVRLKGKSFIIRFNLAEDATVQSGAAVATLEQLGDTTPSTYLDVRVPGRAYYK